MGEPGRPRRPLHFGPDAMEAHGGTLPDPAETAAAAHAAAQQDARVDDYDEPGFDPQSADATAPPAFTRRPPLSAARDDEQRGVFSGAMPGSRLGPAER